MDAAGMKIGMESRIATENQVQVFSHQVCEPRAASHDYLNDQGTH